VHVVGSKRMALGASGMEESRTVTVETRNKGRERKTKRKKVSDMRHDSNGSSGLSLTYSLMGSLVFRYRFKDQYCSNYLVS